MNQQYNEQYWRNCIGITDDPEPPGEVTGGQWIEESPPLQQAFHTILRLASELHHGLGHSDHAAISASQMMAWQAQVQAIQRLSAALLNEARVPRDAAPDIWQARWLFFKTVLMQIVEDEKQKEIQMMQLGNLRDAFVSKALAGCLQTLVINMNKHEQISDINCFKIR